MGISAGLELGLSVRDLFGGGRSGRLEGMRRVGLWVDGEVEAEGVWGGGIDIYIRR